MTRTVGIVIPAYRPDVSTLTTYVDALTDHVTPETIRIELDDATAETLEALEDLSVTVNAVERRRGKGAAITAGFEALETDVLAFVDADGSTPAPSVAAVVAAVGGPCSDDGSVTDDGGSGEVSDASVASGGDGDSGSNGDGNGDSGGDSDGDSNSDGDTGRLERGDEENLPDGDGDRGDRSRRVHLAVGSRRHPEAVVESHQTGRKRLGDAFAWVARRALGIPLYDFQCGAKAIDREAWQAIREHLCEPGFAWDLEVVAFTAALGYRLEEVPITWVDHPHSTVSPIGTGVELVSSLARTRRRVAHHRGGRTQGVVAANRSDRVPLIDQVAGDSVTLTDTDGQPHAGSGPRPRHHSPADSHSSAGGDTASDADPGTNSRSPSSARDE